MAYNFTKSDGTTAVSIPDNQVVSNQFSIDILGRNVSGYGLYMARTLVHMLENFAAASAPSTPTKGQLWYDTTHSELTVYNGTAWQVLITSGDSGGTTFVLNQNLVPDATCASGVGIDIGTTDLRFCNVWADTLNGTATQARYADLAERYEADEIYEPGTLLSLGGEKEVTATQNSNSEFFGVVSTNPAYLMNCDAGPDHTHPPVALMGRVPMRVTGKVSKFDRLVVSDIPGIARALGVGETRTVIGRALQDKTNPELGSIEVTIGVK